MMMMMHDPLFRWLAWLAGLSIAGIGVLVAMNAVGILPPEPYSGFVGIGLGVLCVLGSIVAMRDFWR